MDWRDSEENWRCSMYKGDVPCQCSVCGSDFTARLARAKYCSLKCRKQQIAARQKLYREMEKAKGRICQHCHTQFFPTRLDAKFCSAKCKQASYRTRVTDNSSADFCGTRNRNTI